MKKPNFNNIVEAAGLAVHWLPSASSGQEKGEGVQLAPSRGAPVFTEFFEDSVLAHSTAAGSAGVTATAPACFQARVICADSP